MTTPILIDASPYGLVNNLSFDATQGQTLLTGRSNLVTISGGPQGVLLKRIRNLKDAVDCNGILLYQANDPSRWQFFVGKTLEYAIENKLFGHATRTVNGADRAGDSLYCVPYLPWRGQYTQTNPDNGKVRYARKWEGGDVWPNVVDTAYFPAGTLVIALGVVCTATEGYGVSKKLSDSPGAFGDHVPQYPDGALAYMTTSVGVDKTFKDYFSKVYGTAIARVPTEARSYYESTYAAVMAAYPRASEQPTIAVTTYWLSGQLMPNVVPELIIDDKFDVSNWRIHSNPMAANLTLSFADQEYSPNAPSGGNYPIESTALGKVRVIFIPGCWYPSETAPLPLMCFFSNYCKFTEQKPLVGTVQGLKVGELRDGHVMLRALGANPERYADEVATQKDLAELTNQQLVRSLFDRGDKGSDLVGIENSEDASGNVVASGDSNVQKGEAITKFSKYQSNWKQLEKIRTVYSRSTLPEMLTEFSTRWDTAARGKAGV